jgi:EpsD family peptidyl-prolyl cis-trans isomerase
MTKTPKLCIGVLASLLVLASIAGCGKSDEKKASTQVAAKVNSHEITISQINNVLSRNPNVKPEDAERAKREILDKLIDAELAREEAVGKKLDRSPNVVQMLEAAKTEILARAYIEQVAAAQPKPTPEEIKKYYADHPELFSQRRVYRIEEISLPAKEGFAATLRDRVAKTRTLQDLAGWLKTEGVQFAANSGVRAAEQLPLDFLPQLQTMKDGDIRVFELGKVLQVIRVAASKTEPVDEARASPRIEQFLASQRSREALAKDMKVVKEKAKIEYVGEFALGADEAGAKAKAAAEAKAKAVADAKAKAEADKLAQEDALAKARRAAEEKDKAEAEAKAREAAAKGSQPKTLTPEMEKGLKGVIR